MTLFYKQKLSVGNLDEWIQLYKEARDLWHSKDMGKSLWDIRVKSEGKWLYDGLIHETNSNISTVNSWIKVREERESVDVRLLMHKIQSVIMYVAFSEMAIELEKKGG